ncbi:MAG: 5-(carboxyamino)imidazole ribonucleotide mutase [Bdellovibrionales bacterium]|nr:5-(carboxyamino)imidazole ribonucleotide mutase [Bdellovibrionales bacterium]
MKKSVAIIMGSHSDLDGMNDAIQVLKDFGISHHVEVVSAHRTPEKMMQFSKNAKKRGFKVIIAGAGGAAHLPGMVASLTTLPVIGVPIVIGKMKGLDSLLSIAQMPKGVPVATMAVDNSYNAGLFAARILGASSSTLSKKLLQFQKQQVTKVTKMNRNLKQKLL